MGTRGGGPRVNRGTSKKAAKKAARKQQKFMQKNTAHELLLRRNGRADDGKDGTRGGGPHDAIPGAGEEDINGYIVVEDISDYDG